MVWKNGYIDERELVIFKRGKNKTDGDWYHGLTPATYARHLELVRIAKERTGRTLEISEGWGAYRPYWAQVIAQKVYGIGAADPGTSSHGGYWERKETMAMDYSNWSWVYGGNRAVFYEDVRKAGLVPGQIEPRRGYPDEPWHVIDVNPRVLPSFAGSVSPINPIQKDGFEMAELADLERIVRNVNNESRLNDRFIISYASDNFRNGIVLAGFGYWHPLTGEHWEHGNALRSAQGMTIYNGLQVFTPINDRSYDILYEICVNDGVTEGEPVDYEKIKSLVEEGQPGPVAPVIDYAQLAKALKDAGVTNANSNDIAKAVRDEFTKNPLK